MNLRIILYIICCKLLHVSATAQSLSVKIIPRFNTLSVDDGLSQNSVYSIYQDSKGYMWFGTADGLNRYDGKFIKVYKAIVTANTPANSNFVKSKIIEDKNGNIWYSTETGLFVVERFTEKVIQKLSFKESNGFSAYYPLQFIINDTIWFVHKNEGVGFYSIENHTTKMFPFPVKINWRIAEQFPITSSNPLIWYNLTGKMGIYEFNCIEKKYNLILKNYSNVIRYTSNKQGNKFLYNNNSIVKYSSKYPVRKLLFNGAVNRGAPMFQDFIQDNYQRVWMSTTYEGIYMYDLNTNKLYHFEHKTGKQNSLPINFTNCLFIDKTENLWIGTDGGGVCKINLKPSKFNLFPSNEGDYPALKDYFIKCFYEDNQRRIWYGTHNNGLCIYNPSNQTLKNIHTINGKQLLAIGDIFEDAEKNLWIGHGKGFAIFNEASKSFSEIPLKLWIPLSGNNIFVYRFLQRKNGEILAGTSQKIALIKKTKQAIFTATVMLKNKDNIPSIITDLKELNNGDILLASPSNGVLLIDSNLNNIQIKKRFLKDIDLRCISLNKKLPNHIWVGTGAGLIDLNISDGTHVLYNQNNGLANEFIYGIIADESNNLWLSTNGGISCFNISTKTVKNFTAKDGLQSNEFNTGAYYKGASGNIYFGGIKGFNWFNPQHTEASTNKPQVDISTIKINNEDYIKNSDWYTNKTITQPYYRNDFSFTFSALDFTKPEANAISYQLKNWDKNPIITTNKEINYNNLPSGKYILAVKCSNSNDKWSNEETITIIIQSPFWKTRWFYSIIGILFLMAIILVTRFYTKQKLQLQIAELKRQRELDKERQRISREMHDDIGAGLTQITLMSESAKRNNKASAELQDIADTSRKLVGNMSEIIWSLNNENKTLNQLIAYLREQLHKQLEYSGIQYTIDLLEDTTNSTLDNQQKRNVLLITKELVNNSIKYSKAVNISIVIAREKNTLIFEIKDDGIGFDSTKEFSGNGLKNVKHRVKELNGKFTIQSSLEKGTHFSYRIPLK